MEIGLVHYLTVAAVLFGFGLLTVMVSLVDGSAIVMRFFRVFPLTVAVPCPEGDCAPAFPELPLATTIEGSVGYLAAGRIVPLEAAQIVAERPNGKSREVEVDSKGEFRFVTALPMDAPATRRPGAVTTQLRIRAPGCNERRVPVTRAWTPRPILLACSGGG